MPTLAPDLATARTDLCRFLAACYYEPTPMFTEEKMFDALLIAAATVHPDLGAHARRLGEAFAAEDLQNLLVDYTRLFLGPLQALAKPYGACWLPPSSPTADEENQPLAVLDWYSEGGFDMDETFMELPDHVAVELEFLYLLNYKYNDAMVTGNSDAAADIESLQARFLGQHLGAWIAPFAAAITTHSQTAFYRELALMTTRFVQMEVARLATR